MEKEYVEMKVMNVEFVENEMVELDMVQISQIEVECGDENGKLKSIAHIINDSLDGHNYNVVTDDNATNEINYDGIL